MSELQAEVGPVRTLPPREVDRLRRETNAPLIDVRTPVEFGQLHAQDAKLVPLDQLDAAAILRESVRGEDDPIVVICRTGARGAKAAEALKAVGHRNIVNVDGGTLAWDEAELPVVRGTSKVISLERQVRTATGSLVLVGVLLGFLVHPALFGLSAFVGAGLVFAGVTDTCGMGLVLARMPWNRRSA